MDLPLPLNHVLVDYENVTAIDPAVIGSKGVTFTLLLGPHTKKLDVDLVEQLMTHAASVELVRLTESGRNAVDFALAYYLGRAVAADPQSFFHIISKDTGYDPMIKHLKSRHVRIRRHESFSELSFTAPAKPKPATDEPLKLALDHLCKHPDNRPKRRTTLKSHLATLLRKPAGSAEIDTVIEQLRSAGHLAINAKDTITYSLPQGASNGNSGNETKS